MKLNTMLHINSVGLSSQTERYNLDGSNPVATIARRKSSQGISPYVASLCAHYLVGINPLNSIELILRNTVPTYR